MTLGDIVSSYRKEHKISMDEFSARSGLSKGYISMLEKNQNPRSKKPIIPSLETIKQVADTIGINLNDIIFQLNPNQEISLDEKISIITFQDSQEDKVLSYYRLLNKRGKSRALETLEELTMIDLYTESEK